MFNSASFRALEKARLWSLPRLLLDVALWWGAALLAIRTERAWVTALAILFIGAFPMHDILFHSHEGAHGRLARTRWLNEGLTWLTHAVFALSGSGYRSFHLTHHRYAHTLRDPEVRLMNRVAEGAPGVAWLLMPVAPYVGVNLWPLRRGAPRRLRRRVALDLALAAILHVALAQLIGARNYGLFLVLPAASSLSLVVIMRSICEHHATAEGDRFTNTRTMMAPRLLEFLWSNANYHLEHHLFPAMPFHKLPEVRRMLTSEFSARGVVLERGYFRTALRLLRERRHFVPIAEKAAEGPVETPLVRKSSLIFRIKKNLFRDILKCPAARRHLWSVYYTGEAYEELHPQGVYVDKLPPRLGKLLAKHLADETRHATVFRSFLAAEGQSPVRVPKDQDVGWKCLNAVVAKASGDGPLSDREVIRYMAFLHALELRSLSDLFALIEAARSLGQEELAASMEGIVKDERFHATYTHREVFERAADRDDARRTLEAVGIQERRAYTECMRAMLTHFASLGAIPDRFVDRLRWGVIAVFMRTGRAFPVLPIFDRVPRRLVA